MAVLIQLCMLILCVQPVFPTHCSADSHLITALDHPVGVGGIWGACKKAAAYGNPVFVNRDPVQSSPRDAEGQPCLMYSTIFLFVLCLVKDTIVYA